MVDGSMVSTNQLNAMLKGKNRRHRKARKEAMAVQTSHGGQRKRMARKEAMAVMTMADGSMRPIYDEDGDGVEDNVNKTRDELDRFYEPAVYGVAEDIYNTHHGNLPGHVRKAEYQDAPVTHYGDVHHNVSPDPLPKK